MLAEQYLSDQSHIALIDYKFFCFQGIPRLLEIISDRGLPGEEMRCDFYDMEFHHLDIHLDAPDGNRWAEEQPVRPGGFGKMVEIAKELSEGIPHLRIDLYNIPGKIYFGEFTFFQDSGFVAFLPKQKNIQLGEWFSLPQKRLYKENPVGSEEYSKDGRKFGS